MEARRRRKAIPEGEGYTEGPQGGCEGGSCGGDMA